MHALDRSPPFTKDGTSDFVIGLTAVKLSQRHSWPSGVSRTSKTRARAVKSIPLRSRDPAGMDINGEYHGRFMIIIIIYSYMIA